MATFTFETTGDEVVSAFSSRVSGKTVLITGASQGGLGAETALSIARAPSLPSHILLLGRTALKIDPVRATIASINPSIQTSFVACDLASLDSVREAAAAINAHIGQLDLLINNAGVMAVEQFETNADGIERQFATNHLGHFLLTKLLMPKILAAASNGGGARVVNITSDGYMIGPVRLDDYNFKDGKEYDMWSGYGQSKTANILSTLALAEKLNAKGLDVQTYAVHPGVIPTTSISAHMADGMKPAAFAAIDATTRRNTGSGFTVGPLKTAQQGVATTLVAALDPRLGSATDSGAYMVDSQVRPLAREYAASRENARALWKISEKLVGGGEWCCEPRRGRENGGRD